MSKHIDYLRLHRRARSEFRHLEVSILDNPGSILGVQTEVVKSIVTEITAFTAKSFGQTLDENSGDGVYSHLITASKLILVHSDEEILGFGAEKHVEVEDVVYLHGAVVSNKVKGLSIGKMLMEIRVADSKKSRFAFTTQNPLMYCIGMSVANGKITPSHANRGIPATLADDGQKILQDRPGVFNPETFVVQSLYSTCLYSLIPQCHNQVINHWFNQSLEIKEGQTRNAFLFIGKL